MGNLAGVKVGDRVIRSWGQDGKKLFEVASVTGKYIALCGSHAKWRVSDGGVVNGGVRPRFVQPDRIERFTEAVWLKYVRHIAHLAQISDLESYDWGALDPETARKMHELLPAPSAPRH